MSRSLVAFDRLVCAVLGIALILLGVAGVAWATGNLTSVSEPLAARGVADAPDQTWWAYGAAALGVILVVLGLCWVHAHIDRHRVERLSLRGSSSSKGKLLVDPSAVLDAATDALEDVPGVRSANGRMVKDRGQLVARVTTKIDPSSNLAVIGAGLDDMARNMAYAFGRDDLYCRIDLRVTHSSRKGPRVH